MQTLTFLSVFFHEVDNYS